MQLWQFDQNGFEIRKRCAAIIECPECGKDVELVQETEEWHKQAEGNHIHWQYGSPEGECCSTLFVDHGGVIQMYELPDFPDPESVPGILPKVNLNIPMPAVKRPDSGIVGRVYNRPADQTKKPNLFDWLRLLFG